VQIDMTHGEIIPKFVNDSITEDTHRVYACLTLILSKDKNL